MILAITSADTFDLWLKGPGGKILKLNPVNWEVKILARSRAEAMLSPSFISDREVLLTHDDTNEVWNWGVLFQGQRYVSSFARWFDDMWGSIADTQMIYSRGRLIQAGVDAVRKALEAMESASNKDALSINPESR